MPVSIQFCNTFFSFLLFKIAETKIRTAKQVLLVSLYLVYNIKGEERRF